MDFLNLREIISVFGLRRKALTALTGAGPGFAIDLPQEGHYPAIMNLWTRTAPLGRPGSRIARGVVALLWFAGTGLVMVAYGWCPDAWLWPVRIVIAVAGALALGLILRRAIRRAAPGKRAGAVLIALAPFLSAMAVPPAALAIWHWKNRQLTGHIADLGRELRQRGIALAVVALPDFENVFTSKREWHDLPPRLDVSMVEKSLAGIAAAGVPTGDLSAVFALHGHEPALWRDDEIHLTNRGLERLSGPLTAYLAGVGLGPGADERRKIVLMGNCFAGQFAESIRDHQPVWQCLRGLSVRGEIGQAADSLFLFPGEYLDGTRLIVWLLPRATLIKSDLPDFNPSPDLADAVRKTATIRLSGSLEWPPADETRRLAALPYPAGLITLTGRTVGAGDFPEGTPITALAFGVQDRHLLPLARVNPGKQITLNLIPLNFYFSQNPRIASEYRLNDSDDLTAQRYWIHSWTLVR